VGGSGVVRGGIVGYIWVSNYLYYASVRLCIRVSEREVLQCVLSVATAFALCYGYCTKLMRGLESSITTGSSLGEPWYTSVLHFYCTGSYIDITSIWQLTLARMIGHHLG